MKPIKVKTKSGIKYKADPTYKGERLGSRQFDTPAEAMEYHHQMRAEARAKKTGELVEGKLFADAMIRYRDEIVPVKKSVKERSERAIKKDTQQINRFLEDPIARVRLQSLRYEHFEDWINRRRKSVSDPSIKRELNVMSPVIKHAMRWRWLESNPLELVNKPSDGRSRTRRHSELEIELMSSEFGIEKPIKTLYQQTGLVWLFAIETGMRCSEITKTEKTNRHPLYIHIPAPLAKNGEPRDVPLSTRADELMDLVPEHDKATVFSVSSGTVDAYFRRARDNCKIEDLHFHDSRHEAASRFAHKRVFEPLQLCAIMGWKDPKMAMVYYNPTAAELASRLR